jgi:hypothetical protein
MVGRGGCEHVSSPTGKRDKRDTHTHTQATATATTHQPEGFAGAGTMCGGRDARLCCNEEGKRFMNGSFGSGNFGLFGGGGITF